MNRRHSLRITLFLLINFLLATLNASHSKTIYVDADASGADNGSSWSDAYRDLQQALVNAEEGDEIWVAEGSYYPGQTREDAFRLRNDVALYGGFDGNEILLDEREYFLNETILSGDIGTPFDNSDNSYHVLFHPAGSNLNSSAVIDGFTISEGNADGDQLHGFGGGMYNHESSPSVRNCIFNRNAAINGGGVHCSASNPEFDNVIFVHNTAVQGGAGMDNAGASPALHRCRFFYNQAGDFGGGMSNDLASPTMTNCIFFGNSAVNVGGALSNYTHSVPAMANCSFSENTAGSGAALWHGGASSNARNCIFWNNAPDEIFGGENMQIDYSVVSGGYPGIDNIDSDPRFVDPDSRNLALQAGSPCIDAGNPDPHYNDRCRPPGLGGARNDIGCTGGPGNCKGGSTTSVAIDESAAIESHSVYLLPSHPNPFATESSMRLYIPATGDVRLIVYDRLGKPVRRLLQASGATGRILIRWDGCDDMGNALPNGSYLSMLTINGIPAGRQSMLLLR